MIDEQTIAAAMATDATRKSFMDNNSQYLQQWGAPQGANQATVLTNYPYVFGHTPTRMLVLKRTVPGTAVFVLPSNWSLQNGMLSISGPGMFFVFYQA